MIGTILTDSGAKIPITINLAKLDKSWKILALFKPYEGVTSAVPGSVIPKDDELMALARNSTTVFNESLNEASMKRFFRHISALWQEQVTVLELETIFKRL